MRAKTLSLRPRFAPKPALRGLTTEEATEVRARYIRGDNLMGAIPLSRLYGVPRKQIKLALAAVP